MYNRCPAGPQSSGSSRSYFNVDDSCMGANGKQDQFRLGFLTAIEVPDKGFVGGLLVTNHFGRPLEFQCTAPVKPNPTQEILYGPTLTAFVLGELIGGALVEKAGIKPHLILTDREQILEVRPHVESPVGFVFVPTTAKLPRSAPAAGDTTAAALEATADAEPAPSNPPPRANASQTGDIRIGRQFIRIHGSHADDRELIAKDAHQIHPDADLVEPFLRVREALLETLRMGALK